MKKSLLTFFNFFLVGTVLSQSIDKTIPESFKSLISQKEYEVIVDLCVDYFKPLPRDFTVKEGTIIYTTADDVQMRLALESLVRLIAGKTKTASNKEIIREYFDAYFTEKKSDLTDFNAVKDKLCIRIYPENQLGDLSQWKNFVYRDDLKELKTALILDLPETFQMVRKDLAQSWKVSEEELFKIATENSESKEVKIIQNKFGNIDIFAFISNDYSSGMLPSFKNLIPQSIGKYGAMITIPSKGTVIIHPINKNDLTETFKVFDEKALPIYAEDAGPITNKYYWYYNGTFHLIERKGEANLLPQQLKDLLK